MKMYQRTESIKQSVYLIAFGFILFPQLRKDCCGIFLFLKVKEHCLYGRSIEFPMTESLNLHRSRAIVKFLRSMDTYSTLFSYTD